MNKIWFVKNSVQKWYSPPLCVTQMIKNSIVCIIWVDFRPKEYWTPSLPSSDNEWARILKLFPVNFNRSSNFSVLPMFFEKLHVVAFTNIYDPVMKNLLVVTFTGKRWSDGSKMLQTHLCVTLIFFKNRPVLSPFLKVSTFDLTIYFIGGEKNRLIRLYYF